MVDLSKTAVIIPTVRNYKIISDYVKNAEENKFDTSKLFFILVTENGCDIQGMKTILKDCGVEGEVYDQTERDRWFSDNNLSSFSDIIPKRSHAETSFGLLRILKDDFDNGIFIDDDTVPESNDYFGLHMKNLNFEGGVNELSSDKQWVNVLHRNFQTHKLYPRGYPYSCMNEKITTGKKDIKDVVLSQGLWTGVPDLDAVRILMEGDLTGRSLTRTQLNDFGDNFIAANGNCLTVCSMNLAFRKEIIPAFYQLPMDDNSWKIGRFDDIWSGIIAKKVCDILGKNIITGAPLCIHNKAERSTFKDLLAEVPALELNEHLWNILGQMKL
ncbi:MAG: alpha-1 4-glucan-protein synthase, partial [Candidatus Aenigmatarchaeota archaeon]